MADPKDRFNQPTRIARPPSPRDTALAPARASTPSIDRLSAAGAPRHRTPIADAVAALPPPLRDAPPAAILAWTGLAASAGMILLAVLARSPKTLDALEETTPAAASALAAGAASGAPIASSDDAPPPARTASPDEIDAARAGGLAAIGPLAQRYPSDPAVLKALLLAHAADKSGYSAAMGVARRLFEIAPASTHDDEVRHIVVLAVNGPPDASAQAFELISGKMGAAGPDLLYEIVTGATTAKPTKDRAQKLLDDAVTSGAASPALKIALELRAALPCARKALFTRARDEGDARALPPLKALLATTGCGIFHRFDCYTCLGDRSDLRATISAIETRTAKH
jgi:hypothetical protein